MSNNLPDIQRNIDTRNVAIRDVGVTNIRVPVAIAVRPDNGEDGRLIDSGAPKGQKQLDTVGVFEISCSLGASVKGTHMSRFTEVLNQFVVDNPGVHFSSFQLIEFCKVLLKKMESRRVRVRMEVDYFVRQHSPATYRLGIAPFKGFVDVVAYAPGSFVGDLVSVHTGIEVQGKTCCPCSKEISDYNEDTRRGKGAHAQRGTINISVCHHPEHIVWFEDLFEICARSFSSPIYPILKRPDERAITMGAYENPKFVEDVIRDVVVGVRKLKNVSTYRVRVQNAESIHYHDAFAEVSGDVTLDLGPKEV